MRTVEITVNWNNEDSIKKAEKTKLSLENKGYTLINHFGGINSSVMIYGLI